MKLIYIDRPMVLVIVVVMAFILLTIIGVALS
mgnify:CR=1 FL=1